MSKTNQPAVIYDSRAPNVHPIVALHRNSDGFVTFHRKDAHGNFIDLVAVPAVELTQWFPNFVDYLAEDSYYSLNAFYKGRGKSKILPAQPMPHRKYNALRWLTSCFADLDCGREGTMTRGEVQGRIVDMQEYGILPNVSIFINSGRGLWPVWMLRDHNNDSGGPVRAWNENLYIWSRVQAALGERLASLHVDPDSRDAARVARVPGSLHRKAQRRVAYMLTRDDASQPFVYTLPELVDFLDLSIRPLPWSIKKEVSPELSARGLKGYQARWQGVWEQIATLCAMRGGGFKEGRRYTSIKTCVRVMRNLKRDEKEVETVAIDLAKNCITKNGTPAPLPQKDLIDALKAGTKAGMIPNQKISDQLDITPEESTILPTLPAASQYRDGEPPPNLYLSRKEKTERRRQHISRYVATHGLPTLRVMNEILEPLGLDASTKTIRDDYAALGIKNPRAKPPKPQQRQLF